MCEERSGLVVDPSCTFARRNAWSECWESWESSGSPDRPWVTWSQCSLVSARFSWSTSLRHMGPIDVKAEHYTSAGWWGCTDSLHLMQSYFQSKMLELHAPYEGHARWYKSILLPKLSPFAMYILSSVDINRILNKWPIFINIKYQNHT